MIKAAKKIQITKTNLSLDLNIFINTSYIVFILLFIYLVKF